MQNKYVCMRAVMRWAASRFSRTRETACSLVALMIKRLSRGEGLPATKYFAILARSQSISYDFKSFFSVYSHPPPPPSYYPYIVIQKVMRITKLIK